MEQKRKAGRNRRGRSKRRRELQLRIELLAAVAVVLTIISIAVIQGSRARAEQEAREAAAQTERIQKIRKSSESTPVPTEEPESGTVIQIRMVGDVILHEDVCNSCLQNTGYQFDGLFCNISGEIREADIAIANQETILGGTGLGITGWPEFNSPCEAGDALVSAGFRVILQASNHTLDYGIEGVTNCLNYWKTTHPEAAVLGIHGDRQAAEEIYVYEKDGFRVAILNYTYGTNLNEELLQDENTAYLLNVLDEERVTADVARAKEMADFVIVCPHWGIEDDNNDYSWELSQIEGAPKIERWKYTSDTSQGCLVDGGQYIGNASVTGNKGVTKIIIFMYPQKKSGDGWTNLTTFKDTLAA